MYGNTNTIMWKIKLELLTKQWTRSKSGKHCSETRLTRKTENVHEKEKGKAAKKPWLSLKTFDTVVRQEVSFMKVTKLRSNVSVVLSYRYPVDTLDAGANLSTIARQVCP